jgi:hypothetical protein
MGFIEYLGPTCLDIEEPVIIFIPMFIFIDLDYCLFVTYKTPNKPFSSCFADRGPEETYHAFI